MGLQDMAPELIRVIFEYLSPDISNLCALSLTCWFTYAEATRLLYTTMTHPEGTIQFKFFRTINNRNPRLASLVRVYHYPTKAHSQRGHLSGSILRGLMKMTNLQELAIHSTVLNPPILLPNVPSTRKPPFQLRKFTLRPLRSPTYEAQALNFLKTQTKLTYLEWGCITRRELIFPPEILPDLRFVDGDTRFLTAILPGRRISSVRWNRNTVFCQPLDYSDTWNFFDFDHMLSSNGVSSIRTLSLGQGAMKGSNATILNITALQSLEVIEFKSLNEAISELPFLTKLHQLKNLVITWQSEAKMDTPYTLGPLFEAHDLSHLLTAPEMANIPSFFEKCPGLRYVDVFWRFDDKKNRLYHRWIDGIPQQELCTISLENL